MESATTTSVLMVSGTSKFSAKTIPKKPQYAPILANAVSARVKMELAVKSGSIDNDDFGRTVEVPVSRDATVAIAVDAFSRRVAQVVLALIKDGKMTEDDSVDLNDVRSSLTMSDDLTRAFIDDERWRIAVSLATSEVVFNRQIQSAERQQSIGFLMRAMAEPAFLDSVMGTAQCMINKLNDSKMKYVYPAWGGEAGHNLEISAPNYLALWQRALPNRMTAADPSQPAPGKAHVTYPMFNGACLKTLFNENELQDQHERLMVLHDGQLRDYGAGGTGSTHVWERTALTARPVKQSTSSSCALKNDRLRQRILVSKTLSGKGFQDGMELDNVDYYNHPHGLSNDLRPNKTQGRIFTMPGFPTRSATGNANFIDHCNNSIPSGKTRSVLFNDAFTHIAIPYLLYRGKPVLEVQATRGKKMRTLAQIFTEIEQRALEILAAM